MMDISPVTVVPSLQILAILPIVKLGKRRAVMSTLRRIGQSIAKRTRSTARHSPPPSASPADGDITTVDESVIEMDFEVPRKSPDPIARAHLVGDGICGSEMVDHPSISHEYEQLHFHNKLAAHTPACQIRPRAPLFAAYNSMVEYDSGDVTRPSYKNHPAAAANIEPESCPCLRQHLNEPNDHGACRRHFKGIYTL